MQIKNAYPKGYARNQRLILSDGHLVDDGDRGSCDLFRGCSGRYLAIIRQIYESVCDRVHEILMLLFGEFVQGHNNLWVWVISTVRQRFYVTGVFFARARPTKVFWESYCSLPSILQVLQEWALCRRLALQNMDLVISSGYFSILL